MNGKKIKISILCMIVVYIASLALGFVISKNETFPIGDLEVVAQDFKDGYFYLMMAGSNDTRVLKIDSNGKIVDQSIMKISSMLNNYIVEYEGSTMDISDGYLYCIRRFIDDTTMQVVKREILKLDAYDLSKDPVVIHSYESNQSEMPRISSIVSNNDTIYVMLINLDGSRFYVDEVEFKSDEEESEVRRLMDVAAPINDRFSSLMYDHEKAVALTKSGRVYLYDKAYNASQIYPVSEEVKEYASLIAINHVDDYIAIYDQEQKRLKYYDDGVWQDVFGEDSTRYGQMFKELAIENEEYNLLFLSFGSIQGNMLALITDVTPNDDSCSIIEIDRGEQLRIFKDINMSSKVLIEESLRKSVKYFLIAVGIISILGCIVYVIMYGKKIAYKFVLVIIPILTVAFVFLCYKQVGNDEKVVIDLKLANAMTVNHAVLNRIDPSLVARLRDDRESCWNGVYQEIYNAIQIPVGGEIEDISGEILSENKVAGIDKNYIYNEVFLIKDEKLYTGVSDLSGYMMPMGTQYYEGTENLFDTLKNTGVPQQGSITSKVYRGGCYITPIVYEEEIIGILSTTFDNYTVTKFTSNSVKVFVTVAFYILIAICIPVFIMFNIILKPLRELENAVVRVSEGDYSVKLMDTRNDEFSSIRNGFNKMCDKLSGSIYRINNISNSYFRFVPHQMFKMLDKKDILDIKLGDQQKLNCVLVTQLLHNANEIKNEIMGKEGNNFSSLVSVYNNYCEIVNSRLKETNGALLNNNFELGKIEAVFLDGEEKAIEYAMNVIRKLALSEESNMKKLNVSIIIYKEDILYNIIGEDERLFPLVISKHKEQINDMLSDFRYSGAKLIITKEIKDKIGDWKEINTRYIGYSLIGEGKKRVDLYEILNCCDILARQQKEIDEADFQKALELFYKKDFYLARNKFSDIVKSSPRDNIARWYLFLSHKYCSYKEDNYDFSLYGDKDIQI